MAPPEQGPAGDAIEVFAAWLSRLESGKRVEFDELLRCHPNLAAELTELEATRKRLAAATAPSHPSLSLLEQIRSRFGEGSVPDVSLREPGKGEARADLPSRLIAKLSARGAGFGRYLIRGEVGRGGMGVILKIWDRDLRRHLAMKVILGKAQARPSGATPPIDALRVARFLEEAQVTGQLDHPGIVPVHELGLDPDGRLYFTMKLVKGQSLKEVFDRMIEGRESPTQTRTLGVLLKVCEAMAYAHDKGVIHRDLKPANIMVGKFGEVHVMDWGLARILGQQDVKDIRIREKLPDSTELRSDRDEHRGEAPESPLYTMDGDVVGTPVYMSPEQAKGLLDRIGPPSDVYALGAMLYHLLTGRMPYVTPDARVNNYAILSRVQEGPPASVASLAAQAPADLVAICEKAMAREPADRYADMSTLADDLRAYLEHRVVAAYETGAVAELRKWVERNKPLAASLAAGVLLLAAGLVVSLSLKAQADHNAKVAGQERDTVLGLADLKRLADLRQTAEELWPAHPEMAPALKAWLAGANELLGHLPMHREHLSRLDEIVGGMRRVDSLPDQPFGTSSARTSSGVELGWLREELEGLIHELEAFAADQPLPGSAKGVATRLEFAQTIEERSVSGSPARQRWDETIQAISRSDKYQGTEWPSGQRLTPQLGLLPIGADPDSGLCEFAHLQTGEPASRGTDGRLALRAEMGLIFVLIPGGTFRMGAQSTAPDDPNYDEHAQASESPVREVTLAPFFLSKYEMTRAQWNRLACRNPGTGGDRRNLDDQESMLLRPVEQVTWQECAMVMDRLALTLPTEAQWEYAARAGTSTPWWTGEDVHSLAGAANLADRYLESNGGWSSWRYEEWLDDGYTKPAPIGSFRLNAFGLADVHGNVWEWCRDRFVSYSFPLQPGSGELLAEDSPTRVYRGGGWDVIANVARVSSRYRYDPEFTYEDIGVRPARVIAP